MSDNEYTLDEIDAQASEAMGGKEIVIATPDGQRFSFEHPMFRSKATDEALEPLAEDDAEGIARVLLGGEAEYDKFVAAGGTAEHVNRVMFLVGLRLQDTVRGRPTRSRTSSGSGPKPSRRR